jgi:hypothetical protein
MQLRIGDRILFLNRHGHIETTGAVVDIDSDDTIWIRWADAWIGNYNIHSRDQVYFWDMVVKECTREYTYEV